MPAYGTKEYFAVARKADAQLGLKPGSLGAMVFKDKQTGQPLSLLDNMRQVYTIVAKAGTGQKIAPAQAQRLVNAGRTQQNIQQQRRASGRALGAGQTSRAFDQPEEVDEVRSALQAEILKHNAQAHPFAGARTVSE